MAILQEGARTKGKQRKERKMVGIKSRGQRQLTRRLGLKALRLPPPRMILHQKAKEIGMNS
jgi:hypothetical protein